MQWIAEFFVSAARVFLLSGSFGVNLEALFAHNAVARNPARVG
jgi:hypothetical protein